MTAALRILGVMTTSTSLGTILSVWAHPDDETWLAAGHMAAARDRGQRVVCATASAGERGTDDPATWPPERLGRVRRWEHAAAMAVLGVEEHVVGDFGDGELDACDEAGQAWVADLLAEVRPDVILTFGADGMTFHPDHRAVHRWVTRAWREDGCRGRLLHAVATAELLDRFAPLYEEWGMYMTDERPVGVPRGRLASHLSLSGADLDRKAAALRSMATQTAALSAALGEEVFGAMMAEEGFVAAVPSVRSPAEAPELRAASASWRHPELAHLTRRAGAAR